MYKQHIEQINFDCYASPPFQAKLNLLDLPLYMALGRGQTSVVRLLADNGAFEHHEMDTDIISLAVNKAASDVHLAMVHP